MRAWLYRVFGRCRCGGRLRVAIRFREGAVLRRCTRCGRLD